jgi:hypothetical protein
MSRAGGVLVGVSCLARAMLCALCFVRCAAVMLRGCCVTAEPLPITYSHPTTPLLLTALFLFYHCDF